MDEKSFIQLTISKLGQLLWDPTQITLMMMENFSEQKFTFICTKRFGSSPRRLLLILFSQKCCSRIIFHKQNSSKQKSTTCLNTETTQAQNWSQDPFARLHASKKPTSNHTGTDSRRGQRCYQIHTDSRVWRFWRDIDEEQQTEDFTLNLLPSRWAGFCLTVFASVGDTRFFLSLEAAPQGDAMFNVIERNGISSPRGFWRRVSCWSCGWEWVWTMILF